MSSRKVLVLILKDQFTGPCPPGSHTYWKVMEFRKGIFEAWIKSGVSYSSSATMCLWHDMMGHCPAERRKTRFQILQGVLQEWVYCTKISDVGELKRRIKNEWADLNHAVIERADHEWRQRLRACVRAGGGHFEHMMQRWCDLLHVWRFLRDNNCQPCLSLFNNWLKCTCNYSLGQLTSHPLSFGKGENKSQLIDIVSQPHQTIFQYNDTTL